MKNIINIGLPMVFIAFIMANCDNRETADVVSSDRVKIDSVKIINDTMDVYSVQSIKTYSNYNNGCQGFDGYDYARDNLNRVVTAYKFETTDECGLSVARFSQFNFQPQQVGTYTFKFWQGKDALGNNIYLEKNIVVE